MRKFYFTFLLLITLGFYLPLAAQVSQGGTPVSFSMEKSGLKAVPFEIMPTVDVEALKKEDTYNDQLKDQPWRFGQNLMVNLNPVNSGVWDKLSDGSRLWRLGITSKGALSINLTFNSYKLPAGARLFIYNTDKSEILGAFDHSNNQEDGYFATALIKGESVIIEYYEPSEAEFEGKLNLWRVTHGYRGIADFEKTFGESGTCNINAVCSQGDPIDDQIRSVAMLVTGGSGFCTGALINNTNNDGTPYFLTANHCYTSPGTVVFYFNWQSASCSNPGSSPAYNSIAGATDKATYEPSDFWLMQLNSTPPTDYNVFYAGWNRTSAASIGTKVWCVHHPQGDIKKISWCNAGVTTSAYLGATGSGTNHWRIESWDDGTTTEPGSSGSPLFDTQGRIIGQLHGGYAACGNTLQDYYGKLATSWIGGATNSTRLSNWLDPAGTGSEAIAGMDPNVLEYDRNAKLQSIEIPADAYLSLESIIPGVIIKNSGNNAITSLSVSYILEGIDTVSVPWTGNLASGSTTRVNFPQITLTEGNHHFIARVTLLNDEQPDDDTLSKSFIVRDCGNNSIPYAEGFNSTTLNECWHISNITGTEGELSFVTNGNSPSCSPTEGTHLIQFNSYNADAGSSLRLVSPPISTIGFDTIGIEFDWYQDGGYAGDDDRVLVQYSLDGTAWIDSEEFLRYNSSVTGWQEKTVYLPEAVNHKPEVYIGFLFTSEYGNNCHMDDFAMFGTTIDEPYADFNASTVISTIGDTIVFTDASLNGPFSRYDWTFGEGAVPASDTGVGPHKVTYTSLGQKTVSLMLDSTITETKTNFISIEDAAFDAPIGLSASVGTSSVQLTWNQFGFTDDFETGTIGKWSKLIKGEGTMGEEGFPYWYVQQEYAYGGTYGLLTNWGYDLNTWIISPLVVADNTTSLTFAWESSYTWHVDPNPNGELTLEISTDNGETWDPVWNFTTIGVWENWVWYETTVDLSDFAGEIIQFAFHLVGNDNADVSIDNVELSNIVKTSGTRALTSPVLVDQNAKSIAARSLKQPLAVNVPVLDDYTIYRNDDEIATTASTTYLDESLSVGTYTYYVVSNYTMPAGTSEPSNSVTVQITGVDVQPIEVTDLIKIYPNPSEGLFYIETERNFSVSVLNTNGSVVYESEINPLTRSLDLSELNRGLYILKLVSDENTLETKVMIR